jgi:hypothetical protein
LLGSVIVLAQTPCVAQLIVPAGHTHWPETQLAPIGHAWFAPGVVHAPQLFGSLDVLVQPAEQGISFVGQAQTEPVHVEPIGQTCPHVPQFALSLMGLTHAPAQIMSPAGQPHTPAVQVPPIAHFVPHALQSVGLVARF